jgi:hypothetical protein
MPKLIWKTDDESQYNLFKFYDGIMPCDNNGSYYSFVFKMIELMNQEARIIFANYTFTDNFWEVLDDDKIDIIYNNVILDAVNKLSFEECYNHLWCLLGSWRDVEDKELFTIQKLKQINELKFKIQKLRKIRLKLFYAICDYIDCVYYCYNIEYFTGEKLGENNIVKNVDTELEKTNIQPTIVKSKYNKLEENINKYPLQVYNKILLKDNANDIAKFIYEKISNIRSANRDWLVKSTNGYIFNHLELPLYEKEDLEKVIYEYGFQKAIEKFITNKKYYDRIIYIIDYDVSKIYIGIAYYIIRESFEYMSLARSSL